MRAKIWECRVQIGKNHRYVPQNEFCGFSNLSGYLSGLAMKAALLWVECLYTCHLTG
jgi:hypothetical protein